MDDKQPKRPIEYLEDFFLDLGLPREWYLSIPILILFAVGIWWLVNRLVPAVFPSTFGG